jgi:heme O synthase-like polyprenyltransferase
MNPKEQKNRLDSEDEMKRTAKRPYVKPEVRHERVFETMALTCGKVNVHTSGCRLIRKNS